MNNRTDMPKSGSASFAAPQGRMAIAISTALVTVAGTATIAWAALGLTLAPVAESRSPAPPDIARTSAAGAAFAAHTLAMTNATPTPDRQEPVRMAALEMPRLDPRTDLAAAIAAPVASVAPVSQAQPVAATLPAEVAARTRPVARPEPTAAPGKVTRQPAVPLRVAAAVPVTRSAPAIMPPVARTRSESDESNKLKKIWSVGAFR